jgi:transcriptional regulator with XRE-family HTH domain
LPNNNLKLPVRRSRAIAKPKHEILDRQLKESREDLGLSQRKIAVKLNRTMALVRKVVQENQYLDIETLIEWAMILETN